MQLTATPKDAAGNTLAGRTIAWSSTDPNVASVSSGGWVFGASDGLTAIIATVESKSASAAVEVAATTVPVASVSLSPSTVTIQPGASVQLWATALDAAGNMLTGRNVTWQTSDPSVASVSVGGMVLGVSVGSVTVTATVETISSSATITVSTVAAPVASVSVSPSSANLQSGGSVQLIATPLDAAGNVLGGRPVTWQSSNPSVASVSTGGLAQAVSDGSTVITATVEGVTGSASVTVATAPAPVASVSVSPGTATLQPGATVQLAATPRDAAGNVLTGRPVTWSSSNAAVASVSAGGLVSGASSGTATITATVEGQSGTAAVTVSTTSGPTPVFYSTLDDASAVTNPVNGSGSNAQVQSSPANDFVQAQVGSGFRADAVGERILIPQIDGGSQNVELDRGTIEFWYQPSYNHNDGVKYTIVGTGAWLSPGSLHFGKDNSANANELYLMYFNGQGTLVQNKVAVSNYSWSSGQWIKIRLTWDWTAGSGVQNVHVYLDGTEVSVTGPGGGAPTSGPQSTGQESGSGNIYIGSRDTSGNLGPKGVYDELKVWDTVIPAN